MEGMYTQEELIKKQILDGDIQDIFYKISNEDFLEVLKIINRSDF